MKRLVGKLHLVLGLASGFVVFIVSLTGCLFVFEPQVSRWLHPEWIYARETGAPPKPASELFRKAREALGPRANVGWVEWPSRGKAAVLWHFVEDETPDGLFYWSELKEYKLVYVNPYTAEVQGISDQRFDFFNILVQIHCGLGLAHPIGHRIVGISVLVFLVMMVSGFILWWPRNRPHLRTRLKVAWRGGGRRRNYDLHSVGGFYVILLAFIIAATGLTWSFDWWARGVDFLVSGKLSNPEDEEPKVESIPPSAKDAAKEMGLDSAINHAFSEALRRTKPGGWIGLGVPEDPKGFIDAEWQEPVRTGWNPVSRASFDRYSGRLLGESLFKDQDIRKRLGNVNYDIHVGKIFGLTTQILAFLASGFCASLPVSGFLIWWKRRKKSKRAPQEPSPIHATRATSQPK